MSMNLIDTQIESMLRSFRGSTPSFWFGILMGIGAAGSTIRLAHGPQPAIMATLRRFGDRLAETLDEQHISAMAFTSSN